MNIDVRNTKPSITIFQMPVDFSSVEFYKLQKNNQKNILQLLFQLLIQKGRKTPRGRIFLASTAFQKELKGEGV